MLNVMEADRVRLLDLDAQILDLKRSLSTLRTKRAQVQERLDAYKYPVLTLPNELASEIFIHFLPVYPAPPPLTGLESPTTLTHICHRWREVALATPVLWRALKFSHNNYSESYKLIFDAWMRRSRSCPLSIDIYTTDHKVSPDLFTEMMAMAATRLEHLELRTPCHPHPKIGRMPLLRSLTLAFETRDEVFTYDAPQLRTVVLLGGVVQHVALPWAQLTWLTLNYVGINLCASILRQTKNLVRCDLRLGRYAQPDELLDSPSPDLALPCLESLTLKTTLERVDGFLAAFAVPALNKLELDEIFLGVEPIEALKMFISKSRCNLREVCIRGKNITGDDLYRHAFPSIFTSYLYHRDPWSESDEDDSESEGHSSFSESASE
ncbi:F-box domain-containing protein [Mycena sanguinolenta]|uniref:F-box domain-containing protein n=1 Tax=Mycena sanguinolenta TaxID=230812 RepID=A0A8H7DJP4_9AGAR|nr:F-box domain-containing protein [Mycena sanguinolenta]